MMAEVFEVCDREWRALGPIAASGLRLRPEYAAHDAESHFELAVQPAPEPLGCISAEVLRGVKEPTECPSFATACTPLTPLGAGMVSSEGACAAYYRYRRRAGSAR
jgi:hydrogenase expression/formation protein HypD